MSTFNPEAFMSASIQGANDTQSMQVPEGDFQGMISKVEPRVVGQENPRPIIAITWKVDDEGVRQLTGRAEPTVRQTIWLDVTESGGLDMGKGKNAQLGKLRDALGQNDAGKPWNPGMLQGGVARIKVKHSLDKRDGVTINAEVSGVSKL
jgi:hypothetical protein